MDVKFYNLNYDEVPISDGSLVYCDIPYKNTTSYCKSEVGEFDHEEFYNWVRRNSDKYDIYMLVNINRTFLMTLQQCGNKIVKKILEIKIILERKQLRF